MQKTKVVLEKTVILTMLAMFMCVSLTLFLLPLALFGVINLLPALIVAVLTGSIILGLCILIYVKIS